MVVREHTLCAASLAAPAIDRIEHVGFAGSPIMSWSSFPKAFGRAIIVLAISFDHVRALSCSECVALQEGIQRAIVANISAFEARSAAGTTQTATLEIGQLI